MLFFFFPHAWWHSPFTVLQYAELKPVPCLTYSDAQKLRELSATPILRQVMFLELTHFLSLKISDSNFIPEIYLLLNQLVVSLENSFHCIKSQISSLMKLIYVIILLVAYCINTVMVLDQINLIYIIGSLLDNLNFWIKLIA